MAIVKLDPKYLALAESVVEEFKQRAIPLSDYAEGLLRLSVESWFEDTPIGLEVARRNRDSLRELAHRIVESTLEEEHIRNKVAVPPEQRKPVQFHELLFALGISGRKTLADVLKKGF
jgi:hypothetical protein